MAWVGWFDLCLIGSVYLGELLRSSLEILVDRVPILLRSERGGGYFYSGG